MANEPGIDQFEAQRRLDVEGYLRLPDGDSPKVSGWRWGYVGVASDRPIFLGDCLIEGRDPLLNVWETGYGSHGFVTGWPRGLVGDEHYPPGGFRTGVYPNDAYLVSQGTAWNLGPLNGKVSGRWANVRRLTVRCTAEVNDNGGQWVSWSDDAFLAACLCGLNGRTTFDNPSRNPYWPNPSPWFLWVCRGKGLVLSLQFGGAADDYLEVELIPEAALTRKLAVVVTADLDAGTVTGSVNGTDFGVKNLPSRGPDFRFVFNWVEAPFHVGVLSPSALSAGWWGDFFRDLTFTATSYTAVTADGKATDVAIDYAAGRPDTYPGTPEEVAARSLPLFRSTENGNLVWVFAVSRRQGFDGGQVTIRNCTIKGTGYMQGPVITSGCSFGRRHLDRVLVTNGTVGYLSTFLGVAYPFSAERCAFLYQSDQCLVMAGMCSTSLHHCEFLYAGYRPASFWDVGAVIDQPFVAPGSAFGFFQYGGGVKYRYVIPDWEGDPYPPAIVEVMPATIWGGNQFPTVVDMDVTGGAGLPFPAVRTYPNAIGYPGQLVVTNAVSRADESGSPAAVIRAKLGESAGPAPARPAGSRLRRPELPNLGVGG